MRSMVFGNLTCLTDETVYLVPTDKQAFFSIRNRFCPPEAIGASRCSVNIALADFTDGINEGFGVFVLTKAWYNRIKKAIRSCKLAVKLYFERNAKSVLIGDESYLYEKLESTRSSPAHTRTRPPVRHSNAKVSAKLFAVRRK